MKGVRRRVLLATVWLLTAPVLYAAPLTWTLNDVTFFDGGTAVGTLQYDAQTSQYSAVDVHTTPGFNSFSHIYLGPSTNSVSGQVSQASRMILTGAVFPDDRTPELRLNFASPLTDGGGVVAVTISPVSDGTCPASGLCSGEINLEPLGQPGNYRWVTSGSVSATPTVAVPVPAWALAALVAGLVRVARRRGTARRIFCRCKVPHPPLH